MNHNRRYLQWIVSIIAGMIMLIFICVSVYALMIVIRDDQPKIHRKVQHVSLIKPPPPPRIKEQVPEPIVKREEEVLKQELEEKIPDQAQDSIKEDMPSNDLLGLDADGGSGSDSFGLAAKKGGKSILLGDSRNVLSLTKYAWYTKIIEDEINKRLLRMGKFPQNNLKVLIKIMLDDNGHILDHSISRSSGDQKTDEAVYLAIKEMSMISEPPPEGMPKTLNLRITISS
ncbi:TonB family protein [bacterium]|nr:TonB family protein [bacterium]